VVGPGIAWSNVSLLNEEVQKVQFWYLRNSVVLLQNSGRNFIHEHQNWLHISQLFESYSCVHGG
jgi:hypothetical protein